ncbi:MAG: hypothetical protein IPJ74_06220 [Saprospiraceae bacterium]|nr:hypothetical protein [Saprospiraceae bacterium]
MLAQLFYVGAQAGIWGITINYVIELLPGTSREIASRNYMAFGTLLFVIGRFLGTFLMSYFKDHRLLGIYGVIAILLSLGGVFLDGKMAVYSILIINLFMSIMFPTIFALGVRDIGEHTKLGSSLIIMAIVGGAIVPPIMGIIADTIGIQQSFWIPAVCFIAVAYYGFVGYKSNSPIPS